MDLGLSGKTAIVCAASKGLGRACAEALAAEGVSLFINSRTESTLSKTADEIANQYGVSVTAIASDLSTESGRDAVLSACSNPDILVNNCGGPPPGDFRDWEREDWISAVDANMINPIMLTRAVVDGMIDRKFGRIVNITSSSVKAPIGILGLSNGARAGLTGFIAGLARETVRHNVTINGLLPGPFDTDRLRGTMKGRADNEGLSIEETAAKMAATNPAGRFGQPSEFGHACAFLCSANAGYITGQNLLIDGGGFPGTL